MFDHEFARNALEAGSAIALASGLLGYFVVLRGQVFAGDALSHVAFTGALAGAVAGVDERIGLFAATVGVGVAIGALRLGSRADDTVIGVVFAWVLGVGLFFLTRLATGAGGSGVQAAHTLFGSIYGLSAGQAHFAAVVALGVIVLILAGARPLLFASLDPEVAGARGVPVRTLGVAFLALVGVIAAEATQAVGALLLLGLLAAPAGAAARLTARPWLGLALSAGFALAAMWAGLVASYQLASVPASSAVIGAAVAIYAGAAIVATVGGGRWRRSPPIEVETGSRP
jgi:zinc/manganese transport system permease protein